MRTRFALLSTLVALICGSAVFSLAPLCAQESGQWKIVKERIVSKFAKDVDPKAPLPEYPRPQMVRKAWKNLNGLWDYAIAPTQDIEGTIKSDFNAQGKILVPFAAESALSGVAQRVGKDNMLYYGTTFEVPADWRVGQSGKKLLLHFGAVDWKCWVFVNGKQVGAHTGGYSPFSFDVTAALKASGPQELKVVVWDPTDENWQPRGKQVNKPHGIWYTPVTGIWQTVWIEPVADAHITRIRKVTDIKEETAQVTVWAEGAKDEDRFAVILKDGNKVVASVGNGEFGKPLTVKLVDSKLWSPESPFLYDMEVVLIREGEPLEKVDSYLAMRECKLGKDKDGYVRIMLNGKFLFQHGPLDQGWWPDGLYTAPTDEALKYDLDITKAMGFNMLRKHVKTEPARFYYHCDKMGLLVWQDMPSGDRYIGRKDPDIVRTPESAENFERELAEMIETLDFFPCIVMWVPFNEGWGQYDTERIVEYCRKLDPHRLINNASGWTDRGVGDVFDIHPYPGPAMPELFEDRASLMGEYGGLGLPVKDHAWQDTGNWGYQSFEDREALFNRYHQLNLAMHPMIGKGLNAAVYTQTTDVEIEVNGLMSYDREVIKFDVEKMAEINDVLHYASPEVREILPTAKTQPSEWRYTTDKPADGWEKADFNDAAWKTGKSSFGTADTPGAVVGTTWNTNDIWLRKTVELSAEAVADPTRIRLSVIHDEDATVYVNGVEVLKTKGHIGAYQLFSLTPGVAKAAFKAGKNVIAVHCKQTGGGQNIDLGISVEIPAKEKVRLW